MSLFDLDLEHFTKALNIQGFDLVVLLDASGAVLAEKSTDAFDTALLGTHFASIVQLISSMEGHLSTGAFQSAAIEFENRKLLFGVSGGFILCGIPANSTPTVYAKNEIHHAIQTLL